MPITPTFRFALLGAARSTLEDGLWKNTDSKKARKTPMRIDSADNPVEKSAMRNPIEAFKLKTVLKENPVSPSGKEDAAVALILCFGHEGAKLLFTQRPIRPEDPFSGQVCFPGGKKDPEDTGLLQTAIRETEEEVSLKLQKHQVLGALTPQSPIHPSRGSLAVVPFVFALSEPAFVKARTPEVASYAWIPLAWLEGNRYLVKVAPPVLGGVEVEAFLVPTDRLDSTDRLDRADRLDRPINQTEGPFRGVYTIWGLTFRILVEFLSLWRSVRP